MSRVTMPEPVAKQIRYYDANTLSRNYGQWSGWSVFDGRHDRAGGYQMRDLVTTDQAEAYAAAKVRKALEKAANIAFNAPITADMVDDDSAKALAFHAAARIRDLIPKEQE